METVGLNSDGPLVPDALLSLDPRASSLLNSLLWPDDLNIRWNHEGSTAITPHPGALTYMYVLVGGESLHVSTIVDDRRE